MKKWWTSGRGSESGWIWDKRLEHEPFFWDYWASENGERENIKPEQDSCVVMERDYYYQWKPVEHCRNSDQIKSLPAHHFICQVDAHEPSSSNSIEKAYQAHRKVSKVSTDSTVVLS